MDTQIAGTGVGGRPSDAGREQRPRRLMRTLLTAALACFALPFLTVTCYGDDVTVSGVQAATKIDISPQADTDPGDEMTGDEQMAREEPVNGFALAALIAAATGLALSFGSGRRSRRAAVWAAAVAVIALVGLLLYAFYRTWGEALPEVGLVGAIVLLVAAGWAGVDVVPRWIVRTVGLLIVMTIPATLVHEETIDFGPWIFLLFYAGSIVAVALAVWAIRASVRPPSVSTERPSTLRMAAAGAAGLACLAAAGVGAPLLMGSMLSGEYGPAGIGSGYVFTTAVLAMYVVAGIAGWVAGRAIAHGRRRQSFAPAPTTIGTS